MDFLTFDRGLVELSPDPDTNCARPRNTKAKTASNAHNPPIGAWLGEVSFVSSQSRVQHPPRAGRAGSGGEPAVDLAAPGHGTKGAAAFPCLGPRTGPHIPGPRYPPPVPAPLYPPPCTRPPAQGPSCPAPVPAPGTRRPTVVPPLLRRASFEWRSALLVQCVT